MARPPSPQDCDLLVIWNRYDDKHQLACAVERAGGRVIVAENGYLGRGGTAPKFEVAGGPQPGHYFALALGGHNGSGQWPDGGSERFEALDVTLRPMREDGEHILVCPSRSFGRPDTIMPANWADTTVAALKRITNREIRLRMHPGGNRPQRDLAADLENAWAVVIWASSAGVHALVSGIPVVAMAPYWICKSAAADRLDMVNSRGWHDGRVQAFRRLGWAQWTGAEIASGVPFHALLGDRACA